MTKLKKELKYIYIDGYYKDDKSEFTDYLCKTSCDYIEGSREDDNIFFYFNSLSEAQGFINDKNGIVDFVITAIHDFNGNDISKD